MVQPIDRADDPRIAAYSRVGDQVWLRENGLFVAEGRLVVRRLLESSRFSTHSILLTPAALHSFGSALDAGAPVLVAEPAILQQVTGFNFHRGCLALAMRPREEPLASRFRHSGLLLGLEGIGNPDNVGGLFRVAAAFGVGGVILDPASGDPFYRKAVRTSMGAVLTVAFERLAPWPQALDAYRRVGYRVIALTPTPGGEPLDADTGARLGAPLVVLVGAEGAGLSDAALTLADLRVRIPIASTVDSLNVVVAAGITLAYLTQLGARSSR